MSTRDRILDASLQLFNQSGERNVTTNHIAAHLGMSPGNLYYHFKNKQAIIYQLFDRYEHRVMNVLTLPEGRAIETADKIRYLTQVFEGLWEYRFMHRDMEHLLKADPQLHERYRGFFRFCLRRIEEIFLAVNAAGIIAASEQDCRDLALNTWIIVTSWFSFLHSNLLPASDAEISEDMLRGGIYQVFSLERPYLTEAHRDSVQELQRQFIPRPSWLGI
ncbi:TetR/AcrR family transcriptional regulator [uncultured Thalassolituus sp.]|uniref:TetR/AcrR family transcriptional regulator n=1 Tax=uncultured Thalassolituus sp. TaxID=285273 RepID=UPI002616A4C8|nr:TetR/AcrR family transcriptional regulator [uncultured Thalassolituus sp.]